jgi:hypothetical protein
VARGAADTDAELSKAVEFATLISMSSLGTPDVQNDRVTGRKEIAARLAEQAEAFGPAAPLPSSAARDLDSIFECQVADQLELRGHTFEAELRYRRLQSHPAVASRLALLLDAKGFYRESWQWYLRSARSNDINSLFRLATICWSRGDRDWAIRLAKHAVAQLAPDAYNTLTINIDNLVNKMSVKSALGPKVNTEAVYALGSVLLVLASRADLARLAYCSAATRGHSLAAVSLLDLTRAPIVKKASNWRLSNMLQEGFGGELEKYSSAGGQYDDLDRSLLLLKNDVQTEKFEGLMQVIRAATGPREDAVERILFATQLITILRGYGQFGRDTRASRYIEVAADIVCGKVHHSLVKGEVSDAASLINMIRDWSAQELSNYRQPEQDSSQCNKGRGAEERETGVAMSGTIKRLERGYFHLPSEHKEVLILRLAGLCSDEVANVLGCRETDTDQIFTHAVTRLQEAQQGEQIPTGKLLGAEVDSCFSANIRKIIASVGVE